MNKNGKSSIVIMTSVDLKKELKVHEKGLDL